VFSWRGAWTPDLLEIEVYRNDCYCSRRCQRMAFE
jgi:hypothetical protein